MDRAAFYLTLFSALSWGLPAEAHVGGVPTRPLFSTPAGIVQPDNAVTVGWIDGDNDPTGVFEFHRQIGNGPPAPVVEAGFYRADLITEIAIGDDSNTLEWDLAGVPTGAWTVFTITRDPPFCDLTTPAPGLVVVRREGEPMPLGGIFTQPRDNGFVADQEAIIVVEATGEGAPRVTIEAGRTEDALSDPDDDPCRSLRQRWIPYATIATDVALEADEGAGPGRYRAEVVWDVSEEPADQFALRMVLSDPDGRRYEGFSTAWVGVYHPQPAADARSDPGGSFTDDGGASDPGAATGADAPSDAAIGDDATSVTPDAVAVPGVAPLDDDGAGMTEGASGRRASGCRSGGTGAALLIAFAVAMRVRRPREGSFA